MLGVGVVERDEDTEEGTDEVAESEEGRSGREGGMLPSSSTRPNCCCELPVANPPTHLDAQRLPETQLVRLVAHKDLRLIEEAVIPSERTL